MNKKNVLVIGGGPAGMMAAYAAAKNGHSVVLAEKNEKLGKKLFITGKGRCNITNDADIADFFSNIISNPKFLYAALYSFTNLDTMAYFEENGLKLKPERGGRVFPESDKSSDVIKAMTRALNQYGVRVLLKTSVRDIEKRSEGFSVNLNEKKQIFDAVIVAFGGLSYPSTGSDGKSFELIKKLGHTVTRFEPSLVALDTEMDADWPIGLTLRNISATFWNDGKQQYNELGELLFTHKGISGPLTLSASAYYAINKMKDAYVSIDFKPALNNQLLDARIIRDIAKTPNKDLKNLLRGLLPASMIPSFISRLNVNDDIKGHMITKEVRKQMVDLLKDYQIKIIGKRSIKEAIITRGGVKVNEINPSTMESRLVSDLFFAGEMIDVDALTGGYNLQIAFSTGYLAGMSI